MSTKWTAGPWRVEEYDGAYVIRSRQGTIAKCPFEEDAQVAALAPEMAEVLAALAEAWERVPDNYKPLALTPAAMRAAAILARLPK